MGSHTYFYGHPGINKMLSGNKMLGVFDEDNDDQLQLLQIAYYLSAIHVI